MANKPKKIGENELIPVKTTKTSLEKIDGFKDLTRKQQEFVYYYVTGGYNASDAARKAGYSEKSVFNIGWENVRKPAISSIINQICGDIQERLLISTDELIDYSFKLMRDSIGISGEIDNPPAYAKGLEILLKLTGKDTPNTLVQNNNFDGTVEIKFV